MDAAFVPPGQHERGIHVLGGHVAMVSHPDAVADLIKTAAVTS